MSRTIRKLLVPSLFYILISNMRSFLLASLASLSAINVYAHPTAHTSRSLNRRAIDLDSFRIKVASVYNNATTTDADSSVSSLGKRATAEDVATALVEKIAPDATFRLVNDHYVGTNGVAHFYFRQTANGLDIDTADFNVNVSTWTTRTSQPLVTSTQISPDGTIFSFGNSFYKGALPAAPSLRKRDANEPLTALRSAISILSLPVTADSATAEPKEGDQVFALKQTSGTAQEPEARLVYVQDAEGNLKLTWRVETDILSNWLLTYVDAEEGGKVHAVVDYSADASYQV